MGITTKEAVQQKFPIPGSTGMPRILSSKPQHFQVRTLQAETPHGPPDPFAGLLRCLLPGLRLALRPSFRSSGFH